MTPTYLDDKLESARLRTSGVSSTGAGMGAVSARLSLSDAVSPSNLTSESCEEGKMRERSAMLSRSPWEMHVCPRKSVKEDANRAQGQVIEQMGTQ